jgi:hypothetical protein
VSAQAVLNSMRGRLIAAGQLSSMLHGSIFRSVRKGVVHVRQREGMIIFERALLAGARGLAEDRPVKKAHAHWSYNLVTHLRIEIWPKASTGASAVSNLGAGLVSVA